jgi:putative membrane protein
MVLWLLILPFAFMPSMGPWTLLLCGVVGYQLLGFEDIGVEIESPFGTDFNDLPVDTLQAQIFNNLIRCLAKIHDEAPPAPAVS